MRRNLGDHHPLPCQPPPFWLQQKGGLPREAHGHRGGMSGDEVVWIRIVASGVLVYPRGGSSTPEIHQAIVLVIVDNNRHKNNPATCSNYVFLTFKTHCSHEGLTQDSWGTFWAWCSQTPPRSRGQTKHTHTHLDMHTTLTVHKHTTVTCISSPASLLF